MLQNYNLFLDDLRVPLDCCYYVKNREIYIKNDWVIVRNYDDFIKTILEKGMPKIISFDHDLADFHYLECNQKDIKYDNLKEKTGYHAATWLANYILDNNIKDLPEIYVHSMNPVGKKNIESVFLSLNKVKD